MENMHGMFVNVGLDVGSTTLKCVILDEEGRIEYQSYARHGAQITAQVGAILEKIAELTAGREARLAVSGSAGMGIAEACGLAFLQEVYATRMALQWRMPDADAANIFGTKRLDGYTVETPYGKLSEMYGGIWEDYGIEKKI